MRARRRQDGRRRRWRQCDSDGCGEEAAPAGTPRQCGRAAPSLDMHRATLPQENATAHGAALTAFFAVIILGSYFRAKPGPEGLGCRWALGAVT